MFWTLASVFLMLNGYKDLEWAPPLPFHCSVGLMLPQRFLTFTGGCEMLCLCLHKELCSAAVTSGTGPYAAQVLNSAN